MKKLLIATLAAATVGGAFAEPLVYDYKASVKHMYEKLQSGLYVKYVKTSKLQGYFVQDFDAATLLAQNEKAGAALSQKKGFLVLINKSAEKDYRAPKIMPAQLDVKTAVTSTSTKGATTTTKFVSEAYFYAGPFAQFANSATATWDGTYDDGLDYLFVAHATGTRTYGTEGSTLYLFGQHNVYNKFVADTEPPANNNVLPAGSIYAFGDAWMNGAGFGNGAGKATLCCGWGALSGGFNAISGNLKGGLFLCSIGGRPANTRAGYFTLGLEDYFASDVGAANLAKVKQGDDNVVADIGTPEDPEADEVTWADGEFALSTTDVVSGTWSLKPASSKFKTVELTTTEQAFFTNYANPGVQEVLEAVKGACEALDKKYNLTTTTEPSALNGKPTKGLISPAFQTLYF